MALDEGEKRRFVGVGFEVVIAEIVLVDGGHDLRVPSVRVLTTSSGTVSRSDADAAYELPNDVEPPSPPNLLLPANLLIFAAKLDEATKLGRASTNNENAPRAWAQRRRQGRIIRKASKTLARGDRLARILKEGSHPRHRTGRVSAR